MKNYIRIPGRVLGIAMCIFFCACEKDQVPATPAESPVAVTQLTQYRIKQGNHYCEQNQATLMIDPVIRATVTFDSSAIYTSLNVENQGDVNKLIGFSDCGNNHHENSARLGWSWNGKKIVLYAYAYLDKERIIKTIGAVDINQPFPCSVKAENDSYYFTAGNQTVSIKRSCTGFNGYRYKLFPYFGGDEAAPHDVNIVIVEEQPASHSVK